MLSLGWVLIQYLRCPYKMGKLGYRVRHSQREEDNVKTQKRQPCGRSHAATSHQPPRNTRKRQKLERCWSTVQPPSPWSSSWTSDTKSLRPDGIWLLRTGRRFCCGVEVRGAAEDRREREAGPRSGRFQFPPLRNRIELDPSYCFG